MPKQHGADWKLYRNTGTTATPVWNEIVEAGAITFTQSGTEVDVSTRRGGRYKQTTTGQVEMSLEFDMFVDYQDEDFTALEALLGTMDTIDIAVCQAAISGSGSSGRFFYRAHMSVFQVPIDMPMADVSKTRFVLKPGIIPANGVMPGKYVVA